LGLKATPAAIAVSVPDFMKKRRDIAIYLMFSLTVFGWTFFVNKLVGQAFPKARLLSVGQMHRKRYQEFCIGV
jgi:hypothetical protein